MSYKNTFFRLTPALMVLGLSLAGPAPAGAAAPSDGMQQTMTAIAVGESEDDRRPGVLKPADDHRVEAVSPYTEYCIKKYPFDPEKAYECSLGWVVD